MEKRKKPDWKQAEESRKIQTPKTVVLIRWNAVAGMIFFMNVLAPLAFCIYDGSVLPFYIFTTLTTGFLYIPVAYQLFRNHKNRNT